MLRPARSASNKPTKRAGTEQINQPRQVSLASKQSTRTGQPLLTANYRRIPGQQFSKIGKNHGKITFFLDYLLSRHINIM